MNYFSVRLHSKAFQSESVKTNVHRHHHHFNPYHVLHPLRFFSSFSVGPCLASSPPVFVLETSLRGFLFSCQGYQLDIGARASTLWRDLCLWPTRDSFQRLSVFFFVFQNSDWVAVCFGFKRQSSMMNGGGEDRVGPRSASQGNVKIGNY